MTASQDDPKRPGVAKSPTDSESVGLSTVPRRRIVVGGDPQVGSSNPPAEKPTEGAAAAAANREGAVREKRSSAPAHLRSRRGKLPGTGYSEVPPHAEDRVAPSAIPRAPRVPQIEGSGSERSHVERSSSERGSADRGGADRGGASTDLGARTAVGMLGAGRRATEEGPGSKGSSQGPRTPFRRSDTARSVGNPVIYQPAPASSGGASSSAGGPVSGAAGAAVADPGMADPGVVGSGTAASGTADSGAAGSTGAGSGGTTVTGMPSVGSPVAGGAGSGGAGSGRVEPVVPSSRDQHEEMGPVTNANFPPAYSPSGTLESMSAVRPELSGLPSQARFSTTLTGAAYLSPQAREVLVQTSRDSERPTFVGSHESVRFQSERTMVGLPLRSSESSYQPIRPLRPSPPPVVLSDPDGDSLLVAIAAAAQGQLRESEMPVPSERLEAEVLQQLGKLDEALKSSPRAPSFDWIPPERGEWSSSGLAAEEPAADSDAERAESGPSSSIDAPSPGSVPSQSALPGEGPMVGPAGLPTVGRYEVLARLKSGGMGSVYMCRLSGNAGFRRLFAMKVLHAHLNRDKEALESFQREARVLACVHHPNIVGVVDFGSEREPYIVLEYVEGGSLHELFRATTGGRDPRLLLTIILDVLEGLNAAHGANDEHGEPLGLVHCDLCPQNILVGVDGMARVTDFGIAQTNESRLHPEQLRGKPRYLAPERSTTNSTDQRVDLFSLGVVLYAGLTGVEPFVGETAEETRWNVSNKVVPAPSTVGFRPPPSLDWVCLKALAKDPAGRFQTADEMAIQLRRIAEREGLLASRSELTEWVRMTLAPSLAARRVASRRGTVTGGGRLGSNTPPGVQPVEPGETFLPAKNPTAPPSSAEHTAPLSSEGDFADNTEILAGDAARRQRSRRVLYGMVALCLGIVLWGMLDPESLSGMFSVEEPRQTTGPDGAPVVDDPAGAIVPELGPSLDGSAERKAPDP